MAKTVPASFAHTYAVILAGGSGTRFWPLSRQRQPKQVLKLFGAESLLQQAVGRLEGLIPQDRTYVLANRMIRPEVCRQLPGIPRDQIIAEPASRNTAPAIGLAASEILHRDPDGLMVILPSDHLIARPSVFHRALQAGCQLASERDLSVVLGIKPSRPETGYGYLRLGKMERRIAGLKIFSVRQFTEKPSTPIARRYVRSGNYLWNGGMFIWKASLLIQNLHRYQPQLARGLEKITRAGGIRSRATLEKLYPQVENISIDYALMEKIPDVFAVAADVGWSDVGSWAAAYEHTRKDEMGNTRPAKAIVLDSRRNMILSSRKLVATLGVENLVIVETEDALLVCSRERSQDVGKIVKELERQGLKDLL
ncbi:MAG: mannose-1-phosphate guanylyltransferase [Terriglobia bacterium]